MTILHDMVENTKLNNVHQSLFQQYAFPPKNKKNYGQRKL